MNLLVPGSGASDVVLVQQLVRVRDADGAVADNLASIANHKMGEADELIPLAIIRESGAKLTDRRISSEETTIPYDECIYFRGLKK